jgi:hypothetical protein
MSRRHHGSRPHRSAAGPRPPDPIRTSSDAAASAADGPRRPLSPLAPVESLPAATAFVPSGPLARPDDPAPAIDRRGDASPGGGHAHGDGHTPAAGHAPGNGQPPAERAPVDGARPLNGGDHPPVPALAGCTAPQLRRFIKSRPYVPMHELRRRFGINGGEDDVSSIDLGERRIFVGLPDREGLLLGELLRGGDIGYELSLDPRTPIVIGLYPMRPVARS